MRQIAHIARCWLKRAPVVFDFNAERISSGRLHQWSDRIIVTADGVLPGTIQHLRTNRTVAHAGIQEVFTHYQKQRKTFKEFLEIEKASYTQGLIRGYLNDCKKRQQMAVQIMRGQFPSLDDALASPIENLMGNLENLFRVEVRDEGWAVALRDFLMSGAIDEAPFVIISAAMFASLAVKAMSGQKKLPNQGTVTDISIVSTLLPTVMRCSWTTPAEHFCRTSKDSRASLSVSGLLS